MDANRFDALTKALGRRVSRRAALRRGGAGLATGVVGTAVIAGAGSRGVAQEVTPLATPAGTPVPADETKVFFLFVQTFGAGTLRPKPGEEGVYELTLEHGTDHTVYFSDRPARIVGSVPTERFLEGLGFTPANPPNAALVAQTEDGEDIVIVELFNPRYTRGRDAAGEETATLTYDVRILADYEREGLAHLAGRRTDEHVAEEFGSAQLFIDDCPDIEVRCIEGHGWPPKVLGSLGTRGTCWSWCDWECHWCTDSVNFFNQCNQTFPACNGNCALEWDGDMDDLPFECH